MNKVCKQIEKATGAMAAFDGSKLLFMSAPIADAPVRIAIAHRSLLFCRTAQSLYPPLSPHLCSLPSVAPSAAHHHRHVDGRRRRAVSGRVTGRADCRCGRQAGRQGRCGCCCHCCRLCCRLCCRRRDRQGVHRAFCCNCSVRGAARAARSVLRRRCARRIGGDAARTTAGARHCCQDAVFGYRVRLGHHGIRVQSSPPNKSTSVLAHHSLPHSTQTGIFTL